ncbi:hypothetical protein CE91St48_39610 [Emergencia timonensis]|nr:hypothetical protein CE91St48_39610 [Emergencia timonensis]
MACGVGYLFRYCFKIGGVLCIKLPQTAEKSNKVFPGITSAFKKTRVMPAYGQIFVQRTADNADIEAVNGGWAFVYLFYICIFHD